MTTRATRTCPGVARCCNGRSGEVTISSVTELDDGAIPGTSVIPEATPDAILEVDWLRPRFADDDRQHPAADPGAHRRVAGPADRRRHVPRQRQAPDQAVLRPPADAVPHRPHRGRVRAGHDRHGRLHASARRPHRLEHGAARRSVGADVPERPLLHVARRRGALVGHAFDRRRPLRRLGAARYRRRSGRPRRPTVRGHRRGRARADARALPRSRQRAHPVRRARRR